MKRSEFGKIVRLAKQYLDEEKMWGEAEILLEEARKKDKERYAQEAPASPALTLEEFRRQVAGCVKCPLGKSRLNLVFGTGDEHARLMFVGEGPGFDEDHSGEPFIGNAGQLLTKIIESIGFARKDVYIANIVKCHPMIDPSNPEKRGNDRPPTPEEMQACQPYLDTQIDLIRPKLICTLGNSATQALLAMPGGISKLRGRFFEYRGIPLMPTYHPAALLRNPSLKKDVWTDMKMIRDRLAQE